MALFLRSWFAGIVKRAECNHRQLSGEDAPIKIGGYMLTCIFN